MQRSIFYLLISLSLLNGMADRGRSQPIQAAPDHTGTVVTGGGNQFDISGGTQSGRNLFHSFHRLNLDSQQTANFLAHPAIQTILGRVVGGEPSAINGLIRVSGGTANLFLMNPAGIVFGPDARLNVPAAFTATTANAIAIGDRWFNAAGANDYRPLTGTPTGFAFLTQQPGAIVNSGDLSVPSGQSLTLIGGTVVNTGTLSAPGGQVTIAAIPGEQWVQLRDTGSLLSLELPLATQRSLTQDAQPLTGLTLPQLLTGGHLSNATGVTVNNGVVTLTSTNTPIPHAPGTTVVSGQISVADAPGVMTPSGDRAIQVLGQTVGLLDAHLNASGNNGGTIRVGGDYQGGGSLPTALTTIVDRQTTLRADGLSSTAPANGGTVIVWADGTTRFHGTISAQGGTHGGNGGFVETSGKQTLDSAGGRVDAHAPQGAAGTWLLDPTDIDITTGGTATPTSGMFDPIATGVPSQISPLAIAAALDGGTHVTITTASGTGGNGDITLSNSVHQTGGGSASLTLTGRRFKRAAGATINLSSTGGLTFNLNAIAPEAIAPSTSIQAAQDAIGAVAGPRTIQLAPGTYRGTTPITINKSLTLQGAGATQTVITNTSGTEALRLPGGTGTTVTLNHLAIANNTSSGIVNHTNLTIANSVVRNNRAAQGGAIVNGNTGSLTLTDSQIYSNHSQTSGGGLYNLGNLSIFNSQITENQAIADGGGIYTTTHSTTAIHNSTIQSNRASGNGGGIDSNGSLTIAHSTLNLNVANGGYGGGLYTAGPAIVTATTVDRNRANDSGGGIYNRGVLTVETSTLSHNQANINLGSNGDGGGLFNANLAALSHSTISGNQVTRGTGGGIYNSGNLTLSSNTVTLNTSTSQAGGIWSTGVTQIQNSIVAGNTAATSPDVSGNFTAIAPNLIGIKDGSTGFQPSLLVGTASRPVNPRLGPLANNGGPTQTHTLLAGSPAIDAGASRTAGATDQRGFARIINSQMDLGATESDLLPEAAIALTAGIPEAITTNQYLNVVTALTPQSEQRPPNLKHTQSPQWDDSPILDRSSGHPPSTLVMTTDRAFSAAYEAHLNVPPIGPLTLGQLQTTLQRAKQEKGVHTGVIYAVFIPPDEPSASPAALVQRPPHPDDQLQLILIAATGEPIRRSLPVTRAQATAQAKLFKLTTADPDDALSYIPLAQQFYHWLLQPLVTELQTQGITSLVYCLDEGLRTIPIAAMLDGQTFVIEQYDLAVIPSVALTHLTVLPLKRDRLLAMGAASFATKDPLPAVPIELDMISQHVPESATFLNAEFTRANLQTRQTQTHPHIVHLATHAEFNPGNAQQSYIQLWDTQLNLKQVRSLNWHHHDLSLLILSACTTAVSSREAELGFAGLAAVAGVRSAIGTLWTVSDVGTLALMAEFYAKLKTSATVSSALRQAQIALLKGSVHIHQGALQSGQKQIALPGLALPKTAHLRHPFYWSPFIVVGNPW